MAIVRSGGSVRVCAAVAVVGILAAGCNGGDTAVAGSSSAPSGKSSVAQVATKPAKDLVLTAAELPAGVEVVPVSDAQFKSVMEQITGAAASGKFVPAECASATALVDATKKLDPANMGILSGATESGSVVSEAVVAAKSDIAKIRDNLAGKCKSMTAEMTTMGQQVFTKVTTTLRPAPNTAATNSVALEQNSDSEVSGRRVHQKSLQGYAEVGAYTVSVAVIAIAGEPDSALFDKLFTTAVDKVAKG